MTGFHVLAELAERLAGEGSKLKKRAWIATALDDVARHSVEDAGRFALYLAGQPFAEADARKLNAGGAILSRVLKDVSGASDSALTAAYRRHGDMGAAAADVWPATLADGVLTLDDVATAFEVMACASTTKARGAAIEGLLRRASALEAKYLLKLMLGDMRIGVKQSLVEEAIAEAASAAGRPAEVSAVRHAVMLEADLARAVTRAFSGTLAEARMTLFHPLGFMLASPVDTPEEAVARFTEAPAKTQPKKRAAKKKAAPEDLVAVDAAEQGLADDIEAESAAVEAITPAGNAGPVPALVEDKYDGMRAQVHCGDAQQPGRVAIYSRNREDITASFPELAEAFHGVTEPLILDGEILGWDYREAKALPFAIMGQRIGRKKVDDTLRASIPVTFMAFDLLFERGELLLPFALRERRARLEQVAGRLNAITVAPMTSVKVQGGLFETPVTPDGAPQQAVPRLMLSPVRQVAGAAEIDRAYADARARANEGVMLKALNSAYLPGRRGLWWVKLKRELATLDVVITGAEFGHGRRAQLLSDYTFAVRGPEGELLNVGKAYSGVTDMEIAELTAWLKLHTLEDFGHFRTVEPLRVLEVAFNNIMRSERHASGFALRFPRILRVRDDKPVEEIDTLERVEEIYQSQPDRPVQPASAE